MVDVLKIALDRRAALHEEAARLDEFIRMAAALLNRLSPPSEAAEVLGDGDAPPEPEVAPPAPQAAIKEVTPAPAAIIADVNVIRRGPAAATG